MIYFAAFTVLLILAWCGAFFFMLICLSRNWFWRGWLVVFTGLAAGVTVFIKLMELAR